MVSEATVAEWKAFSPSVVEPLQLHNHFAPLILLQTAKNVEEL